ncbi:16S rRNA (guanine(527)-N(7))-methyltransferase RsmG [Altererythrobacter aquiaggeris]|uniref:16S rRNA (guanine(527)-N(7))-methyltransferase RsmG n=1 Tax=Aestuarierythrobacter aquiaggeris TaxID=1898396 RepID=UPI003015D5FF
MIETEEQASQFVADMCDSAAMERLIMFCSMLREEAARQNLVSKSSLFHMWVRHIADSAQLLSHVPRETQGVWLDLGTGAGLPGMVVALMRPNQRIRLVESRRKRIEWLEGCIDHFELRNCSVDAAKLENVETTKVSVISARAFAPLPVLLKLSARFSTRQTIWLLPKGRSAEQELEDAKPATKKLFHVEQSVTSAEARILVGKGQIKERQKT